MKTGRNVLGRGLSALISTPVPISSPQSIDDSTGSVVGNAVLAPSSQAVPRAEIHALPGAVEYVSIDLLVANPGQPRQEFSEQELAELSDSIKKLGVLQPILVRPAQGSSIGKFEIVAGERRYRAAMRAQLAQVPVIVKHISDRESLEIALVENVQRANLNPVEEARAYQRLVDEFGLSQQELAERVGKERASVANIMRVLKLPEPVLDSLKKGDISLGHAKAILTIKEPAAQISLCKKVISEALSVRALEAIVSRVIVLDSAKDKRKAKVTTVEGEQLNPFPEVVDKMRTALGTKVLIKHHQSGRGRIEIDYFSEQELDRIVDLICR